MNKSIFFTMIIVFIVICGLVGSMKYELGAEAFSASNDTIKNSEKALLQKSLAYFKLIAPTFMTDDDHNQFYNYASLSTNPCKSASSTNSYISGCPSLQIMKFLPNLLDSSCDMLSNDYCNTFYIDNVTCADNTFYDSPIICSNITGAVSLDKEKCKIRVLNNNYSFMKRCIQVSILKASIIATDSSTQSYQLQVQGNIDLLVLLRPCFISFAGLGLYSISLFSLTSAGAPNTLLSYTSDEIVPSTISTLYLTQVDGDGKSRTGISPNINGATTHLSAIADKIIVLFPTIYYLNYEEPSNLFGGDYDLNITYNTFSLCLSSSYLTSKVFKSSYNFSPTTTAANTNTCQTLHLNWSIGEANVFYVTTSTSSSDGHASTKYPVHNSFSTLVNQATKGTICHVMVTYTMDLLIIVTMFKDLTKGNQSHFSIVQYPVRDAGNVPVYMQYNTEDLRSAASSLPSDSIAIVELTSIPNFAATAKRLGYSFVGSTGVMENNTITTAW